MELLKADRAIELLREVVAEAGELHVYEPPSFGACFYWHDAEDKPGCLAGQVLYRHGWSKSDLKRIERCNVKTHPDNTPEGDAFICAFIDPSAQKVLREAQLLQDKGAAWGTALKCAEDAYKSLAVPNA